MIVSLFFRMAGSDKEVTEGADAAEGEERGALDVAEERLVDDL